MFNRLKPIKIKAMFDQQAIIKELYFKAIRSSGAGGQHVNKTSSKVELSFDLGNSQVLSKAQIEKLKTELQSKLTKENILILQCGESRSQHRNKSIVIKRFLDMLVESLTEYKERKPTKIPKAVKKRRLKLKRKHSEKKANRKPPHID